MKKLIVSALLIAFGSVYAHAMDDAPSVSIGGSAKLGVKNSDDGDATTEDLTTVAEYDISLSSSGVTDGGLEFGASINIDGRGNNHIGGDGFQVYIGASDGSWKLQFGEDGDHAGIDVVGNIGLANADDISGATVDTSKVVPLTNEAFYKEYATGAVGGEVWKTAAVLGLINDLLGNEKEEDKYKILGTTAAGSVNIYYYDGLTTSINGTTTAATFGTPTNTVITTNYTPANDKETFELNAKKGDATAATDANNDNTGEPLEVSVVKIGNDIKFSDRDIPELKSKRTNIQLSGNIAGFEYRLSSGEGLGAGEAGWSLGAKYALNNLSFGLGLDHNKVQALSAGGSFDGNNIDFTYIRQNNTGDTLSYYVMDIEALDPVSGSAEGAGNRAVVGARSTSYTVENKYKAYGVKFGRDLGSGTSISATYSKLDNEVTSTSDTRLELNFDYSLGGGATFYVEIDKDDLESKSTDTTNIEAGVKMKF